MASVGDFEMESGGLIGAVDFSEQEKRVKTKIDRNSEVVDPTPGSNLRI